ncbi:TetR/AcrR family transcriptional regulator [Rhodovulum sulfidophilum]|uniref:TetR/AcrR family transcriptional regulator n=1 Tax=Rhodovulum sulfidophilum TaxID=35806 RepID=UPI0013896E4E|nr:TetR family transcriptional regulator [Rhodovulum sulfidophilum]NDK35229.1 TetR family transcriptional regulator [Rhodovulum sulfidophilum]
MRSDKRDELVRKALDIFYRDGFHATGLDRLSDETGISKTTMFRHFRSKDDLILATMQRRDDGVRAWLHHRMDAAGPPRTRLMALYDALGEWVAEPGFRSCLFLRAAAEYPDPAHPIHRLASEHKRRLARQVEAVAAEAGAADPGGLSRALLLLKDGAAVAAHLGHAEDPVADARAGAEAILAATLPAARQHGLPAARTGAPP